MPNPTEISLLNYNFEAKACNELLTAMLNHSDLRTEISAKKRQLYCRSRRKNHYGYSKVSNSDCSPKGQKQAELLSAEKSSPYLH